MKLNKFYVKSIAIAICAILFIGQPAQLFAYMYQKDEQPGFILPRSYTLDNVFSPVNALQIPDSSKKFKEQREKLAALILQTLIMPTQSEGEDPIQGLIKQLGDEKWAVREEAQKKLIEMGDKCLPEVRKALNNSDPEVATRVKAILTQLAPTSKEAEATLILMDSNDQNEISKALEVFKGSKDKSLIPFYINILEKVSLNWKQKHAILDEIKEFGSEASSAVGILSKCLYDKSLAVRGMASIALSRIGTKEAALALLKALGDGNPEDSGAILRALSYLPEINIGEDVKEASVLCNYLRSDNEAKVLEAIKIVGKLLYSGAEKDLVSLLKEEKGLKVRKEAAKTLGKMKIKGSSDALFALLNNPKIGKEAALALGEIGDERALQTLVSLLENKKENVFDRSRAALLLGKIGGQKAEVVLFNALKDESLIIRNGAVEGISYVLDYSEFRKMFEDKNTEIRLAAVGAITRKGEVKAIEDLITLLKNDESPKIRATVAYNIGALASSNVLGEERKSKIVSALTNAAKNDNDPDVQKLAKEALAKIK